MYLRCASSNLIGRLPGQDGHSRNAHEQRALREEHAFDIRGPNVPYGRVRAQTELIAVAALVEGGRHRRGRPIDAHHPHAGERHEREQ